MRKERLEFYDPLYETIVFEKGLPDTGFNLESRHPLDAREFVRTAEFVRLAFLRQAGLAWLVFPSATHTRFAHSIGCWWLGRLAESLIEVRMGGSSTYRSSRPLKWWLDSENLREEFYLGLLFHDVGHGPLSHVLEHNETFVEGLKRAGLVHTDHESRGALLLRGEERITEIWQDIAASRYGRSVKTFSGLRDTFTHLADHVCLDAVCYLMTGHRSDLERCQHGHRESLHVVKELVSGLLDLDRLDHYPRDSYFSGLRQTAINIRGFLGNLHVELPADLTGEREPLLSLSHEGVSYAASLLFSKRQIISVMFRNPRTVAVHAMANWALTAFLESLGGGNAQADECLRIALMEDDQFIDLMASSSHSGCRYMTQRIRSIDPYYFVGKWANVAVGSANQLEMKARVKQLSELLMEDESPKVLCHFDRGFWSHRRSAEPRDWLDTGHLFVEDTGCLLTEHADYKDDFSHLREADRIRYMWVFSRDSSDQDIGIIRSRINEIMGSRN